jgi:hypothetical protein
LKLLKGEGLLCIELKKYNPIVTGYFPFCRVLPYQFQPSEGDSIKGLYGKAIRLLLKMWSECFLQFPDTLWSRGSNEHRALQAYQASKFAKFYGK